MVLNPTEFWYLDGFCISALVCWFFNFRVNVYFFSVMFLLKFMIATGILTRDTIRHLFLSKLLTYTIMSRIPF